MTFGSGTCAECGATIRDLDEFCSDACEREADRRAVNDLWLDEIAPDEQTAVA